MPKIKTKANPKVNPKVKTKLAPKVETKGEPIVEEKTLKDAQLELGKFLFHQHLGHDNWQELDNAERHVIIGLIIADFQSSIEDDDRVVEFCYTIDNDDRVQLMAVPKDKFNNL
jgi:hypothetical protein